MTSLIDFYRDELKDRPLMPALLAQADIRVPPNRLICVPSHIYPDTKPSVYVYPSHLTDYGDDNRAYDLLAVARDWLGLQLDQAVSLIAELAGVPAPTEFHGEIKKAKFAPLAPLTRTDPNDYAIFATRSTEALQTPSTLAAEAAERYLSERGILNAARHYRVGVVDSTVTARAPHRIWRDMLTFPTWHGGSLLALKGRNLLPKDQGREMRNLAGTGTAPYGLRELRENSGVIVCEGETDTLSIWEAFQGRVSVIGIPGATHWKHLQHPALKDRHLFLCLDTDTAGLKAVRDARQWAADEGRALIIVPGIGDKNSILVQKGSAFLRDLMMEATTTAARRASRVLL